MSSFTSWLQSSLPPAITAALMRFKRALMPSPMYRRLRGLHASVGRPEEVLAGPFKGMRYIDPAAHLPKLLGTYENELHDAIERLCALQPDVILNVGSAEGYYAVGLARRLPAARVIAYDISPLAQYHVNRLASANGVRSRVEPRGLCTTDQIERVACTASRPAVLIDCEGCEADLLDPAKTPSLRRTIVLVELHERCAPGVTQKMEQRFGATHDAYRVPTRDRSAADLPPSVRLSSDDIDFALRERTDRQEWWLLTPKA